MLNLEYTFYSFDRNRNPVEIFQIDGMSKDDMRDTIRKYDLKSPTGNELTDPMEFNLMFSTSIGPAGNVRG